jgi:hypothetical protein
MKVSTSALAAIVAFGTIAGSAPSEAQETRKNLRAPGDWFRSKQLLVIRSAIPSENIRAGILKSPPPGIGLWPSTPLEKLQLPLL